MSDGTIGVILLVAVVVTASLLMHSLVLRFWLANLIAAVLGTVVLHTVAYIERGYSDPFDVVSIPISFLVGLGLSALVGTAVNSVRRSRRRKSDLTSSDDEANKM